MSSPTNIGRADYFAAMALQGLLASGQFTNETEDGLWAVLDECDVYYEGEERIETGEKCYRSPAVELSWRFAEWMLERKEPK